MANPVNFLPPDFDNIQPHNYDPDFTADISSKMRVPDKIGVTGGYQADMFPAEIPQQQHQQHQRPADMNMPERILVAGQDQHIGMHRDLRLDPELMAQSSNQQYVGLSTPPRVLTLEERPFPVLDDRADELHKSLHESYHDQSIQNGYWQGTPKHTRDIEPFDLLATPGDGLLLQDDVNDFTRLYRQVTKLTRHVQHLEDENVKRAQRELFLYPLLVGYFLFQCAKWFLRSN